MIRILYKNRGYNLMGWFAVEATIIFYEWKHLMMTH